MPFRLSIHRDTVSSAPLHEPLVVTPGTPLREAVALMREHGRGSVIVCRSDRLEGIVTERDVVRLLAAQADLGQPVEAVMSAPPAVIAGSATMAAAMTSMRDGGYRRLPVLDEAGRPTRVLKVTDVIRYLVDYAPETVHTLPPTPQPRTAEREGP